MASKNQVFPITLIGNILMIALLLVIAHFSGPTWKSSFTSVAGIIAAGIFITFLQKVLTFAWVYRYRLMVNTASLGLAFLIIGLSYILTDTKMVSPGKQFNMMAFGVFCGLIWGIADHLSTIYRGKTIPYSGAEEPILSGKATIASLGNFNVRGRVILLSDRLVFLGKNAWKNELPVSDIREMHVQSSFFFPFRLVIHLQDAKFLSIYVSMPYIWKKKIEDTM